MTVFVDTSALLALLDGGDEHHGAAVADWQALAEAESALVTSNYVVLETIAVAQHRLGLDAVRALVRHVLPLIIVIFIDEPLQQAALSALLAAGRRRLSLVDCASFEVMRRRQIHRVFGYDAHFDEQGFEKVVSG
jgi:predicted nucleic acid-binding protein